MRVVIAMDEKNKTQWLQIALVAGLALLLGPGTVAAEEDQRFELPAEEAPADDDRPTLGAGEAPRAQARQFVEQRQFEGLQLADEAIVRLRNLAANTPIDNPDRAEYLYNLAGKYWGRSRHYENQSIEMQDECFLIEDEGDEQAARRCRFRIADMKEEADRLREESIDLYIEIIRHYPTFEELDTIYYQLGTNMMQMGEQQDGLEIFRRLLAEFPQTEYMPHVLLYFGDYHFDEGEFFDALDAYRKVIEYRDSSVYQYGRYMLGWTYFNLENYERALEEFLMVADSAAAAEEGTAERAMLGQVRNDIVRAYSRIGDPDRAIGFFQELAPDREDWLNLSERLAVFYGDQAAWQDSTRMYRNLVQVNRSSVMVVDYQYEIVRNITTIDSYSQEAIQEILRLLRLVQMADAGEFDDSGTELHDEVREKSMAAARRWATTYHREGRRTQNRQLSVMAHHLYLAFGETFADSDDIYDLSFFHGELLYELEEWSEAAAAYERVLDIDPHGEYTERAVLNTMLALLEVVEPSEARAEFEAEFRDYEEGQAPAIPEPAAMGELESRLMRASKNYMEIAPQGERIVEVKYTKARTYYDHNQLERAAQLFEDIAFNHSDHRLADVSANLHLGSLDMLQDFEAMADAVERYLEVRPVDDDEFNDDLYQLNMAIRYNICVTHDEEEEWEEGAHCYVRYVEQFPDSDQLDLALYNAALNFERIHEIQLAIRMRQILLDRRPDSELAAQTLFNLAGNFHAWAIYGQASSYYEAFVRNFPDHERAEDALATAANFRHGLGEFEPAIANYEHYLQLFGDDNPETAAEVYFSIGEIYQEQGRDDEAYRHFQRYIAQYGNQGSNDRLMEAHVKTGMHHWERGDRQEALSVFNDTLRLYERLSEEERNAMRTGRDSAAQAKFMIAEDRFERAESIRIQSSDSQELTEQTTLKMEALTEARELYEEVILFRRAHWAIASLFRIGRGFHDFAQTLRESPVPSQLTAGQAEQYRALLEDNAMQFEAPAVQLYEMALETTRDQNWYNEYTEQAEAALAELRPADYRRPSEIRAQPDFLVDGFMNSNFIDDIDEGQLLEELGDDDDTLVQPQAAEGDHEATPSS